MREQTKPKRNKWWVVVLVVLPIVVVLLTVGLLVARFTIANPYRVPSGGMMPTLVPNGRILVDKTDQATPRGRIIVFRYPEQPSQEFVQRVIGLPGETVSQHDLEISINGKPIAHCVVGRWQYEESEESHSGELWLEGMDGARWLVFHDARNTSILEGSWTVKPDEVFTMGDNRENSHDGRMWRAGKGGGVPRSLVVGTVADGKLSLPQGAESLQSTFDACMKSMTN
jgi:signal peptidase I